MAKAIMIQGTMSNVGKSLVAAGLCRIFHQDGYKCAPFKAQNMALNSYVTDEGLEMGRAQVMQAEAAGIRPRAEMNPILLKPTNDTGSQVIVNGKSIGNYSARDYFSYKKELIPNVMSAYRTLAEEFDVIVIEGAGSPAEINLKDADHFVNMDMAKLAEAPVLLVGDIDRGGVFAQLYGTTALLTAEEQKRIRGYIINKFRGDVSLLSPGPEMLESKTGIPVVGTVPMMPLKIDDEDSLTDRFGNRSTAGIVDLAVIRLPRISNFSDFSVFDMLPDTSVRYVRSASELGTPDMIILPGSKDTIGDLTWLKDSGLADLILQKAAEGTVIFGICGGFQMLGRTISDPLGAERQGTTQGLGLLPHDTIYETEKHQTKITGVLPAFSGVLQGLSGKAFSGYEIHMGVSSVVKNGIAEKLEQPFLQNHQIYGTYVHGIFDASGLAAAVVRALAARKGYVIEDLPEGDYAAFKETQYDLLADTLRGSLDMKRIYQILEEGI